MVKRTKVEMVCLGIQVLYEEVMEVEERLVLHNEKVKLNCFSAAQMSHY